MELNKFISENLFNATTDFFGQLDIKLNSNTTMSLDAKSVLGDIYKVCAPFDTISETYFAGRVDDSVFQNNLFDSKVNADEALNETNHGDGFMIFALNLDKKPNRTEISELTRAFNQRSKKMPVLLVLSYIHPSLVGDGRGMRCISLSLPERLLYRQSWRQGEKVGKTIILRDINCETPHAGHLRILRDLASHNASNFNELHTAWLTVLDVNILNKRFYVELSNWYFWALQSVQFPDDIEKNEEIRNSTNLIRLITRIIFIWFIKEKGLAPELLFEKKALTQILKNFNNDSSHDYYNAILQNLFFATLNQKMTDRRFISEKTFHGRNPDYNVTTVFRFSDMFSITNDEVVQIFKDIPFLNGGLFDCLDKENENHEMFRIDGFTNNEKKRALVPDFLFFGNEQDVDLNTIYDTKGKAYKTKGLINILNSYKFTVAENTPLEEDVALDPELLGKVFENLLASYNPETQTTARKQTGSFYTPREIVDYMAEESLKAYLDIDFSSSENLENLADSERLKIIEKIDSLKILDPACGSGAFPMGVLHKLITLLKLLDPDNRQWKQRQIDKAEQIDDDKVRENAIREIEEAFESNELDYGRKLFLIENCIYGVDIQPIAIQISKLRFFLSLVIEQKTDKNRENLGIRPLPNLETKFVAANTLIGLEHPPLDLFNVEIPKKQDEIRANVHKYFSANNRKSKLRLQDKERKLYSELGDLFLENAWKQEIVDKVISFNRYDQNDKADWFDSELMFGIKDGFDVVIGNPPYVQLQKNNGELSKIYGPQVKKEGNKDKTIPSPYKTFDRMGDLYSLFYEKGWQLLKPQGRLCFITSNKWMRAGYGENTRNFFAENTNPKLLIDFAGVKVFDSATVDVNILMFSKEKNQHKTQACIVKKTGIKDLGIFVRQNAAECSFGMDSWVVLSPIEQRIKAKIETVGTPLKDWDIQINYGIKTGFNEAFIIDGAKKAELIAADPKSSEIIRPVLRGRDIKRYGYEFADLWLINTHNGVKEKGIKPIEINDYPAIKTHLDKYWDKIKSRADQGDTPYNLRNCAYIEDFYRPKIIYSNMSSEPSFALDNDGFLTNQKCFILIGNDNLEYLFAFFNSQLFKFIFNNYFPVLGEKGREMSKIFMENIPVPTMPKVEQQIETLLQTQDYQAIDKLVYEMYGLNKEEIEFIESL